MAKILYLIFCLIGLSATVNAQTYADQQQQYRSYQAQHLATVRAYSVPSSSYTSPTYKSSSSSGSGSTYNYNSSNKSSGGTVRARPGSSNWSAYIRSDIKPFTNDDYDDYKSTNASYTPPRPLIEVKEAAYYRGSKSNSCQGDCSETLTTGGIFIYTGNTLNGVPNGKGVIKWKTATYTGDVKNGMPDGEGSIVYENGISHKGSYSEGQFNGRGTMDYGSGSVFTGMFVNGIPTKGLQRFPDGMTYDGNFLNGEFHGLGELKWGNKYLYNGDFKHGNFEGEGVLEVGKITFAGDFRNNKAYYGTIRWPSGDMFTGYVQTGIVNIVPKVGAQQDAAYTYSGWFDVNGKRSGYGYHVDKDGTKTEGQWLDGKLNNVGMITYTNGQIIKGKIDYKGAQVYGTANHQEHWYGAQLSYENVIGFLDNAAAKDCIAATTEAEDFIIAGRKKYNDLMSTQK